MTDNARLAPESQTERVPAPWDYYYLRYFLGTIVGAGLLVALWVADPRVLPSFGHALPPAPDQWTHLAAVIAALGTAGLAYCYIASAPILLLHGFRFRLPQKERWWPWCLFRFTLIAAVGLLGWTALHWGKTPPSSLRNGPYGLWLYAPYGVIVLLQIAGVSLGRLDTVRRLYNQLAHARAIDEQWVAGYVESYKHLREHGNAFLIILMEVETRHGI